MKHIAAFNGAVTSKLHSMGLNSKAVLCACNAWRGSVKGTEEVKSSINLSGKVSAKGEDKRVLTVKDSIKETAKKVGLTMPGLLVAISDGLNNLTDKLGVMVGDVTFPEELTEWLESVDAFKPKKESAPVQSNPITA